MASLIKRLKERNLVDVPKWLPDNVHYETIMGSVAYGVSSDTSDCDVYGFCIPPKNIMFPHLAGFVEGFDKNIPKFEQYQQHHIKDSDAGKEYDFAIYSLVKYIRLCGDGNPNMVDSLFTPADCILHISTIGTMVKDARKLFLSKACYHTFKGYAYSQRSKIRAGANASSPKRQEYYEKFGYDIKFAYHLIRLLNECEQILAEGDLDLRRNNEQLKSIRKGEWTLDQIDEHFVAKEKQLEELYVKSDAVPYTSREDDLKTLLLNCLEHHYGSMEEAIGRPNKEKEMLKRVQLVLDGKL